MKQFTFWNVNDTAEHVTIQFRPNGAVMHLSRDTVKSVSPMWHQVGTWRTVNGNMTVRFTRDEPHLGLAATQLARKGASVSGSWLYGETQITSRETNRATDPDTLLGQGRRKSLNLGIRGKCDPPSDWRERAAALNAARK